MLLLFVMAFVGIIGLLIFIDGEAFGIVLILIAVFCGFAAYGQTEANPENLAEIGKMIEEYPELKPLAIKSNEDDKITKAEYIDIKNAYNKLELKTQKEKLIPALVPETQPNRNRVER